MSDAEFDELKAKLKAQGSLVAVSKEPRCFIDTGVCSVTFTPDRFRAIVLYVPAFFLGTLLWGGGTYELIPATRGLNPILSLLVAEQRICCAKDKLIKCFQRLNHERHGHGKEITCQVGSDVASRMSIL